MQGYSMLVLVVNVGADPLGEANSENPKAGKTESNILNFDRDKPIPFLLSEFVKHFDKVQGREKQMN